MKFSEMISTLVIRDFTEKSTLRVVAAWNCLRELESHRRLQQLSTASSLIAAAAVAKSSWCQYRSTLGTVTGLRPSRAIFVPPLFMQCIFPFV